MYNVYNIVHNIYIRMLNWLFGLNFRSLMTIIKPYGHGILDRQVRFS